MARVIEGKHTCVICKGSYSWSATISKDKLKSDTTEIVITSTFFTVEGRKADLAIYTNCPSCDTKYKFESSCPVELIS